MCMAHYQDLAKGYRPPSLDPQVSIRGSTGKPCILSTFWVLLDSKRCSARSGKTRSFSFDEILHFGDHNIEYIELTR